jgi:hypothetical protein
MIAWSVVSYAEESTMRRGSNLGGTAALVLVSKARRGLEPLP